jgi:hypothetical protein
VLNYLATLHYRAGLPEIPKPTPPDSKTIVHKGNDLGDWIAHRSNSFWTIVVIIVAALVVTAALKRPFVKGIAIGAIILAIMLAVVMNK